MRTMPFGKYKGQPLEKLPDDYIEWLLTNVNLRPQLKDAITQMVTRRLTPPPSPPPAPPPKITVPQLRMVNAIIRIGAEKLEDLYNSDEGKGIDLNDLRMAYRFLTQTAKEQEVRLQKRNATKVKT